MVKNEILLIVGPNASGKTRLLREFEAVAAKSKLCDCEREPPETVKDGSGIVLFDEPFARLGKKRAAGVADQISQIAEKRKVIVATIREDAPMLFSDKVRLNIIRLRGSG